MRWLTRHGLPIGSNYLPTLHDHSIKSKRKENKKYISQTLHIEKNKKVNKKLPQKTKIYETEQHIKDHAKQKNQVSAPPP